MAAFVRLGGNATVPAGRRDESRDGAAGLSAAPDGAAAGVDLVGRLAQRILRVVRVLPAVVRRRGARPVHRRRARVSQRAGPGGRALRVVPEHRPAGRRVRCAAREAQRCRERVDDGGPRRRHVRELRGAPHARQRRRTERRRHGDRVHAAGGDAERARRVGAGHREREDVPARSRRHAPAARGRRRGLPELRDHERSRRAREPRRGHPLLHHVVRFAGLRRLAALSGLRPHDRRRYERRDAAAARGRRRPRRPDEREPHVLEHRRAARRTRRCGPTSATRSASRCT